MFSTKKSREAPSASPQSVGEEGETTGEKYLMDRQFRIVERNFRCNGGEIDLIGIKGRELHFIEVKTRRSPSYGDPILSIDSRKRRRISQAANYYLFKHEEWKKFAKVFSVLSLDYSQIPATIEFIPHAFEDEGGFY